MASEEHLRILEQGVKAWNQWREENPEIWPDLSGADLENLFKEEVAAGIESEVRRRIFLGSKGYGANLSGINFAGASLWGARAQFVNLSGANLAKTDLTRANLRYADLSEADLSDASLYEADLYFTNLSGATLVNTSLLRARLVETNLENAKLDHCYIHGVSVWGLKLNDATQQRNFVISNPNNPEEPPVTVDNIEVAQFVYLLLNNRKIRDVIDTITSKVVLILGRFTSERKAVLDAIRDELRKRDYLPVLFDFEKPVSRDLTETVRTLAHLARFIIADITEPRSIPQELQAIVPDLAVPVQPLLLEGSTGEYGMFQDLKRKYHWVLSVYEYKDLNDLLASLGEEVITPAETKAKELEKR
jgi:hypothetical protein